MNQMLSINSRLTLNNGNTMPYFGLGVYLTHEGDECRLAVHSAIKNGYELIDTASFYENEKSVGQAILTSGRSRQELFVTTKLWNSDQGYDNSLRAFEQSYNKMGLDYIDLYLIHYPVEGKRKESWKALERLADEGVCKSVGVSNYMHHHMEELLAHCNIPPSVNQIELSPYCYESRQATVEICQSNSVIVQSYAPLTRTQKFNDPLLLELAKKYQKSPAQILIRWSIQHGFSVIPKSSSPERIIHNASVFDFEIDKEDIEAIQSQESDYLVCWDPMNTP
jgi:diketogulonate reductase-like aldo/keto reductase